MEDKNSIDMIDVIRGFAEDNPTKTVNTNYFIKAVADNSEVDEQTVVDDFFKICKATKVVPMDLMFAKLKKFGLIEGLNQKADKKMINFLSNDSTLIDLESLGEVKDGDDGQSVSVNINIDNMSTVKRMSFQDWINKIDKIDFDDYAKYSKSKYFNDNTIFSVVEYMCASMPNDEIHYNGFIKTLEILAKQYDMNIDPAEELDELCYYARAIPMFRLIAKLNNNDILTEEGKKGLKKDLYRKDELVDMDSISDDNKYTRVGNYEHAIGMKVNIKKLTTNLKVMTFKDVFERAKEELTPDGNFK